MFRFSKQIFFITYTNNSKKRQYEHMLEQLHSSERQNAALKKKLEVSQQQKDEFMQVAVDKEKALQAALVHLNVAQVHIFIIMLRIFYGNLQPCFRIW